MLLDKKLYGRCFHEWNLIPLKILKMLFRDNLTFRSILSFNKSYIRRFSCFYKNILSN